MAIVDKKAKKKEKHGVENMPNYQQLKHERKIIGKVQNQKQKEKNIIKEKRRQFNEVDE